MFDYKAGKKYNPLKAINRKNCLIKNKIFIEWIILRFMSTIWKFWFSSWFKKNKSKLKEQPLFDVVHLAFFVISLLLIFNYDSFVSNIIFNSTQFLSLLQYWVAHCLLRKKWFTSNNL